MEKLLESYGIFMGFLWDFLWEFYWADDSGHCRFFLELKVYLRVEWPLKECFTQMQMPISYLGHCYTICNRIPQCGNHGNLLSHCFGKNFVNATFSLFS